MTFDEFVATRLGAPLRYATALSGDPQLAQDLVQDVLVKVHRRWSRIAAGGVPEAYVKKAVVNEYVSWRRRWHVRHVIPTGAPPERAALDPDLGRVEESGLWQEVARLAPRYRAVLMLRYHEGLSDAEIAELLGCGASTVRGHASRALAILRASMPNKELPVRGETR